MCNQGGSWGSCGRIYAHQGGMPERNSWPCQGAPNVRFLSTPWQLLVCYLHFNWIEHQLEFPTVREGLYTKCGVQLFMLGGVQNQGIWTLRIKRFMWDQPSNRLRDQEVVSYVAHYNNFHGIGCSGSQSSSRSVPGGCIVGYSRRTWSKDVKRPWSWPTYQAPLQWLSKLPRIA